MDFSQITLNQMQKVHCFSERSVTRTISDKQQKSYFSRHWREAEHMLLLSAGESYATVANILKTINLEEPWTHFKWEAAKRR